MDALPRYIALSFAFTFLAFAFAENTNAAGYRTTNFTVAAPTVQLAKEIGDAAEAFRLKLAKEWLGKELPTWAERCPIKARVSPRLGAGGATSFMFDRGEVYGWRMNIQGSRVRILDSVLPHEITHTIFASHFRQPLPRWADEGACTTVEHRSEIAKQESMLIEFLRTRRALPFSAMMRMKEYPNDVMPLYSQGHSVTHYLLQRRGKKAFLEFVGDGMQDENWPRAVEEHYGYKNLMVMQTEWLGWVRKGRPAVSQDADVGVLLASSTTDRDANSGNPNTAVVHAAVATEAVDADGQNSTRLATVAAKPERPAPNIIYREKVVKK